MFPGYLSALIAIPVVGAIAVGLVPRDNVRGIRLTAAAFTVVAFLLSLLIAVQYDLGRAGLQFVERAPWIPSVGISVFLAVDGLSLPMVVLTTMLTFAAAVASFGIEHRPKEYFILLLILEAGILGVFTALDLVLFFLFWEVELVPMYLLILLWGGPRREYAAIKFVLYTVAGSALMLVGILALYFYGGARTFDVVELAAVGFPVGFQLIAFPLLFLGFAIKLPMFPFHTWLPDAHVEAPTAVSVILAGVLLKMGGYGMFRICLGILPEAAAQYAYPLAIIAVVNVLYGAGVSMVQTDLKKLVAYSSVSHMGYVLLGLAALTPIGLNGAALQMFTHGTITGLLFLLVGLVYDKAHTRQIPEMGGLAHRMPWVAVVFVMAGLASLGLPGMSGFVAEFLVFVGSFPVYQVQTILAVVGIVITAGYILWMLQRAFFGPLNPHFDHLEDAKPLEMVPLFTLLLVILLVGVYPAILTDLINSGVMPLIQKVATVAVIH